MHFAITHQQLYLNVHPIAGNTLGNIHGWEIRNSMHFPQRKEIVGEDLCGWVLDNPFATNQNHNII